MIFLRRVGLRPLTLVWESLAMSWGSSLSPCRPPLLEAGPVQMLLEYWPPFLERPITRKRHQLLSWMEKVGEDEDLLGEPGEAAGSGQGHTLHTPPPPPPRRTELLCGLGLSCGAAGSSISQCSCLEEPGRQ